MTFQLIDNADVRVTKIINPKKQFEAEIVVNDKYIHRFSAKSRVSKHLDLMEASDLAQRLTGGKFFFIGNQLVDFRDGGYNGFVHTDDTIAKFMEVLGYQTSTLAGLHRRMRANDDHETGPIVLRKVWNDAEIEVPLLGKGGDFNSQLSFVWNPFVRTVNSAFDLVRLICTNGMVGLTSFLNTRVPVMNRWEEHLDIAARQIQNKVNSVITTRMVQLADERCSVADTLLLEQHCFDRLYAGGERSEDERNRIRNLMAVVSPKAHLAGVYRDTVFTDRNLAAQLPGHLSAMDVFNIATELRSHTADSKKSTGNALDRIANNILFDREDNFEVSAKKFGQPKLSNFSSAETAFFGKLSV